MHPAGERLGSDLLVRKKEGETDFADKEQTVSVTLTMLIIRKDISFNLCVNKDGMRDTPCLHYEN